MDATVIGVPRERKEKEGRVGLTPALVRSLRTEGYVIIVEKDAGLLSGFSNEEYIASGALLALSALDVYRHADIVVKVKEPIPEEYQFLPLLHGKILFTYLHLAGVSIELTKILLHEKITAIAYEAVENMVSGKRIFPLLAPMSKIAGTHAMRQAIAYRLSHSPVLSDAQLLQAVIIGGGNVGEAALREGISASLGSVCVFELSPERILELKQRYARSLPTNVCIRSLSDLYSAAGMHILEGADIVVSGVLKPGAEAPKVLSGLELSLMKSGAYIADVAIDQGGSTEWSRPTKPGETYRRGGVVFSCVPNIPGSTVPREATLALSEATYNTLNLIAFYERIHGRNIAPLFKNFSGVRKGLQTWNGYLCNAAVAQTHQLSDVFRDADEVFS